MCACKGRWAALWRMGVRFAIMLAAAAPALDIASSSGSESPETCSSLVRLMLLISVHSAVISRELIPKEHHLLHL